MSPRTRRARPAAAGRAGMTLVEVVVAVTILGGAMLGMASFVTKFSRTISETRLRASAGQLATQRLEEIKSATSYDSLNVKYAGTEHSVPGYPRYVRETFIQRVGGDSASVVDYRVVTVVVTAPALKGPVRKTTIISNF